MDRLDDSDGLSVSAILPVTGFSGPGGFFVAGPTDGHFDFSVGEAFSYSGKLGDFIIAARDESEAGHESEEDDRLIHGDGLAVCDLLPVNFAAGPGGFFVNACRLSGEEDMDFSVGSVLTYTGKWGNFLAADDDAAA